MVTIYIKIRSPGAIILCQNNYFHDTCKILIFLQFKYYNEICNYYLSSRKL